MGEGGVPSEVLTGETRAVVASEALIGEGGGVQSLTWDHADDRQTPVKALPSPSTGMQSVITEQMHT